MNSRLRSQQLGIDHDSQFSHLGVYNIHEDIKLRFGDNKKLWFTSDNHFGHANVIKFCARPFLNVDHMDQDMISRWNAVVKNDDTVFHLGDFAFKGVKTIEKYVNQLNGKIILIRGNHDEKQIGKITPYFHGVHDYLEIDVRDESAPQGWQHIVLCHYAFKVWNRSHYGSWSLHGHSHGSLKDDPFSRSFDVGVDCHDYTPLSYSRVREIIATKCCVAIDHHGGKGDNDTELCNVE
jgi:calcineurin-like phosphoesterase family protein